MTKRIDAVSEGAAAAVFTDDDHLDAETVRALAVEAGAPADLTAALLNQLDD
jgi:hypothetical protein